MSRERRADGESCWPNGELGDESTIFMTEGCTLPQSLSSASRLNLRPNANFHCERFEASHSFKPCSSELCCSSNGRLAERKTAIIWRHRSVDQNLETRIGQRLLRPIQ